MTWFFDEISCKSNSGQMARSVLNSSCMGIRYQTCGEWHSSHGRDQVRRRHTRGEIYYLQIHVRDTHGAKRGKIESMQSREGVGTRESVCSKKFQPAIGWRPQRRDEDGHGWCRLE